jgi:2-polyprenyl-6-hydroxyphenyl methylase/3-demethylubiquinone-9 3-methyltransferase
MASYYSKKLSGRRLERCYEVASPRVVQYLEAEIRHVLERLEPTDAVLELGCGYGRVALRLAAVASRVVGIDTAAESLELAKEKTGPDSRCEFILMDAVDLKFSDGSFDRVVCAQNGICSFRVDQERLVREALRVVRPGGLVQFSTYSDSFWPHRLEWFEAQAAEGLVGEIDYEASGDGIIVCKDGFKAGRLTPDGMRSLCARLGVRCEVEEVDRSSLFCEIMSESTEGRNEQ